MTSIIRLFSIVSIFLLLLHSGVAAINTTEDDRSALKLTPEEQQWLIEHPTLKLGVGIAFPPFQYVEEDGGKPVFKGMVSDYIELLSSRLGVSMEPVLGISFDEALKLGLKREVDIFPCVARTPEREQFLLYTEPYLTYPLVIITREDTSFIGGVEDLHGRKVATIKALATYSKYRNDLKHIDMKFVFKQDAQGILEAVALGEADACVVNLAVAGYYINLNGWTNLRVAAPTPWETNKLAMAARSDHPILRDILQKGLNSISIREHNRIKQKWIALKVADPFSIKQFLIVLSAVVLGALLLIGFFLLWNRKLAREIRKRKLAEESIRASEERWKALFDGINDAVLVHPFQEEGFGKFIEVNDVACRRYGYSREEFLTLSPTDLTDSDSGKEYGSRKGRSRLNERGKLIFEARNTTKYGEVFPVEISSNIYTLADRKVILSTVRDISKRKQTEEALRESDLLYKTVIENTGSGMCIFEQDTSITFVNKEFEAISGYSKVELIGNSWTMLIAEQDLETMKERHYKRRIDPDSVPAGYEFTMKTKDGTLKNILVNVKLVPGTSRSVVSLIDITDRKRAENELNRLNQHLEQLVEERTRDLAQKAQELEEANEQLLRLDELKNGFVSSISHEFRTPLTSLLGFAKLIKKDFAKHFLPFAQSELLERKSTRILDNLNILTRENERLTRLVNDFLDLSKIESGRIHWHDQYVDVVDVLRHSAGAVGDIFEQKSDVRLILDLPESLPTVFADPDRLEQVFLNLIHNAAKFTDKGSVTVSAEVLPDNRLRVRIKDTGQGIPADDMESIFDKFHQVLRRDTMDKNPAGTGLGLAICKQIVEHYSGSIRVASQPDQGAEFTVELPTT